MCVCVCVCVRSLSLTHTHTYICTFSISGNHPGNVFFDNILWSEIDHRTTTLKFDGIFQVRFAFLAFMAKILILFRLFLFLVPPKSFISMSKRACIMFS